MARQRTQDERKVEPLLSSFLRKRGIAELDAKPSERGPGEPEIVKRKPGEIPGFLKDHSFED